MATIQFPVIPYTSADLNAPGRGAEDWHNQNRINIPAEGTNTQRLDAYFRSQLTWCQLESTQGNYTLQPLINLLNSCITKRQKISFGIMTVYHDDEPVVTSYDGGRSSYPQYLHALMQSESVKDWKTSYGGWVPNYNSTHYLVRLKALHVVVNNLLETGSFQGVKYKDVVHIIDVRGYGNYGEWHNGGIVDSVSQIPSGAHATSATLKKIIDTHTEAFPNFQLSIIMTAFDYFLNHTKTSPEVGYYALTTRNAFGKLGWRRDNWGAGDGTGDTYIDDLLIDNVGTWNGVQLKTLIMEVWKYAPVTGEPMNDTNNNFAELEAQVRKYHAASFGNGNIASNPNTDRKNRFRAASKACGYRLQVESADITVAGKTITARLNWRNAGIAPPYITPWAIEFYVSKGGVITKIGTSSFKLRGFQPAGVTSSAVDIISADVADGTYELLFKVVDPSGYLKPMPLYIQAGTTADGAYSLGSVALSGGVIPPPVNRPPVVDAGPSREITLPTKSTTLVGTASDPDGTIKSTLWSFVSGPEVPVIVTPDNLTTTVNFNLEGSYVFRLVATDNLNATSVDEVSVRVNATAVQKTVVEVRNVSTVTTVSTVVYSDGTTEVFPKPQP